MKETANGLPALADAWQAGTLSRRAFLERAAALGVGAAAAALLEGRSARPAAAQTTQKRELVIAQGGDISKLDPHFSTSSNDIRVTFNVFDNLTNRHPDGKLQPGLATEWKATGTTTWTFKLRQGVKFHNGDPLTAEDVKFSIERTYDPNVKTLVSSVFTTVSRIETPDPGTVVIHTKALRSPCSLRAWRSTAVRSSRSSTSSRLAATRSTPSPSARGLSASCPGPRTTASSSRPTRTTGADGSRWTASSSGRSPRSPRAWPAS